MKKMLFIAAIAALSTTSCTKDRVCTCIGDYTGATESKMTLVKVTNGQAKAQCVTTKYTDSKGNTSTNTCKLD